MLLGVRVGDPGESVEKCEVCVVCERIISDVHVRGSCHCKRSDVNSKLYVGTDADVSTARRTDLSWGHQRFGMGTPLERGRPKIQ